MHVEYLESGDLISKLIKINLIMIFTCKVNTCVLHGYVYVSNIRINSLFLKKYIVFFSVIIVCSHHSNQMGAPLYIYTFVNT